MLNASIQSETCNETHLKTLMILACSRQNTSIGKELFLKLSDLINTGNHKQVKYSAAILGAAESADLDHAELVQRLVQETADPRIEIQLRGWVALESITRSKAALLLPYIDELAIEFEDKAGCVGELGLLPVS